MAKRNKQKQQAQGAKSERRDVRNEANDAATVAVRLVENLYSDQHCKQCGHCLFKNGDCEQCEAMAHDWREDHPFPDSCFEGMD